MCVILWLVYILWKSFQNVYLSARLFVYRGVFSGGSIQDFCSPSNVCCPSHRIPQSNRKKGRNGMKRNRGGREVLPVQAIVPVYFTSLHGSGQVLRLCQDLGLNSQLTHTHTHARTQTTEKFSYKWTVNQWRRACARANNNQPFNMEYIFKWVLCLLTTRYS